MFAITRSLVRSPALRQGLQMAQAQNLREVSMKVVPAASTVKNETFFDKNNRLQREMSPHLTIYKPQLTSMLSITHRGTGIALTAGVWALGLAALTSPQDIANYASVIEGLHLSAGTLTALKFMIAYPLAFHTANGVRHLLWDTGRFLKIKEVYSTGYAMVGVSFALAAILAML
ncbi:succinate dehydrogenase cytochrome b560 subunit, mitochondrial-like [Musca domestica]|uniref:Succinate dehydrogenase cytochrome b560 subunit, mitochondrial-like n=1 Tax=Musca domestica TaxID=7370 RepID=A0ABM3UYD2_MUSDO|nr:succinate dehydrogenase cytochrome b560 subunit, mitochondrial-like [Musca domestica]XP_058978543.1 succinate dehydrogenase cytochrome b560 subunit, mitochondrial-like [Musca domestica]